MPVQPLGFSYIRFSHPDQAKGDSVRRQEDAGGAAAWCARNKVQFDTSLTIRDEGRSAFKRSDFDTYALARFLDAVKAGTVPKASYLIVENLDRLSRESEVPALNLFTSILVAEVKIVQLSPREQVFSSHSDLGELLPAILELSRGHSESKAKSVRVGSAWAQKRKLAAEGEPLTRKVPGWVRFEGGKLGLIPDRAVVVRRIFAMARDGHGVFSIATALNAERVPCWRLPRKVNRGEAARWNETAVYFILKSAAAHGEFQPCQGSRSRGRSARPVGDPIPGYFPAAVTTAAFHAAHQSMRTRRKLHGGRRGKHINLFSGLLRDARDGGSLTTKHHSTLPAVLIPVGAKQGTGVPWVSFPAKVFEDAIMGELVELSAADILPDTDSDGKVRTLSAREAEAAEQVHRYKSKSEESDEAFAVFADKAVEWERKRMLIAAELAEARGEAASPPTTAWVQFRTAGDVLKTDNSDENRVRCRESLRGAVESVWALYLPGQGLRAAAAQVFFKGGAVRGYLIVYQPPTGNHLVRRPAVPPVVKSFKRAGLDEDRYDLRKQKHVPDVAAFLARVRDEVESELKAGRGGLRRGRD